MLRRHCIVGWHCLLLLCGEQRVIAISQTAQTSLKVALAFRHCQLAGLRRCEFGVIAGWVATAAGIEITLPLATHHRICLGFGQTGAVTWPPTFHAIPTVALMLGGCHRYSF